MDPAGISRAAGVGPTIELGGVTYAVKGRVLQHYGEIEADILARRPDPFDLIRPMLATATPEMRRELFGLAFDRAKAWRNVTQADITEWFATPRAKMFSIWLAVRDNDPQKLTLEAVTSMVMDKAEEAMRAKIAKGAKKTDEEEARSEAFDKITADIAEKIDQASGEDVRGNSTGPTR